MNQDQYQPKDNSNEIDNGLPEFRVVVSASLDVLTLQYKDNTTSFTITNGTVNGWELDDCMTKYIANLTDTEDLRSKLSGK